MSSLQIKHLPDEVHEKLRARARAEHSTVSAYVTRLIEKDVAKLTTREWLAELRMRPGLDHDIDIESLMDDVRNEREGR